MEQQPKETPQFESCIDRKPKRHVHLHGRESLDMNEQNTMLFTFAEEYSDFDHVWHKREDGGATWFFKIGHPNLYQTLEKQQWKTQREHYPSERDEQLYLKWQSDRLATELGKLAAGGEL